MLAGPRKPLNNLHFSFITLFSFSPPPLGSGMDSYHVISPSGIEEKNEKGPPNALLRSIIYAALAPITEALSSRWPGGERSKSRLAPAYRRRQPELQDRRAGSSVPKTAHVLVPVAMSPASPATFWAFLYLSSPTTRLTFSATTTGEMITLPARNYTHTTDCSQSIPTEASITYIFT